MYFVDNWLPSEPIIHFFFSYRITLSLVLMGCAVFVDRAGSHELQICITNTDEINSSNSGYQIFPVDPFAASFDA